MSVGVGCPAVTEQQRLWLSVLQVRSPFSLFRKKIPRGDRKVLTPLAWEHITPATLHFYCSQTPAIIDAAAAATAGLLTTELQETHPLFLERAMEEQAALAEAREEERRMYETLTLVCPAAHSHSWPRTHTAVCEHSHS